MLLALDVRALVKAQFAVEQRESAAYRELADRHARQVEQDLRLRLDAALAEVKAARVEAGGQLRDLRTETLARVDAGIEAAAPAIDRAASAMESAAAAMDGARTDLQPVLQHTGSVVSQVDGALSPFLDCEDNPDCAFNRYQGASKAFEQAMQQMAKTMPEVHGIASDFHDATHNLDQKFFHPPPLSRKQKVIAALREFAALVIAYLRSPF